MVVPDVADYEVRRELTRIRASASLRRLDELVILGGLLYAAVTTVEWRKAAEFWADARTRGLPTASRDSLDADVVLAACAATIGQPGDLESVPEAPSDGCRVGATHQRKALVFGGLHPPYECGFRPFWDRLLVMVATMNVGHLTRYCDARLWTSIA